MSGSDPPVSKEKKETRLLQKKLLQSEVAVIISILK